MHRPSMHHLHETVLTVTARSRWSWRVAAAALSAVGMLALAACSGSQASPEATGSATTSTTSQGFPVTITHALGTTTIPSKPTRVSTIGWSTQDAAIALGVIPVDMPKTNYGDPDHDDMLAWTRETLEKAGATGDRAPALHDETDGYDYEAIADTRPDVILGIQSGVTREQYDRLSGIAPTVPYVKRAWGDSWREVIRTTAKALGVPEQGTQLTESLEKTIADARAEHTELTGKNAAVVYFDTAKFATISVYTTHDARANYLEDLGLAVPQSVKTISQSSGTFYKDISSENADQLDDVDVIVTYGGRNTLAALRKDPLMSRIPAVRRGSVAVIDEGTSLASAVSPSALSIPATIDQYLGLIAAAARKA